MAEFLRFCIVGGIAFVVDAAILEFLVLGEVPTLSARVISIAIALQVSYLLHRRFTFNAATARGTSRWARFMAGNLVGAAINYSMFAALLTLALSADAQMARVIALIFSTTIALIFNYWVNRTVVFADGWSLPMRFSQSSIGWLTVVAITVVNLAYALSQWHTIPLADGLPTGQSDPDTWLRLTLVRDWLQGGSWFDHRVMGSDAPLAGSTSPWTRPLDVVIAAFVAIQPESVDLTLRLMRASLLLPPLWMALLVIGIHRAIRAIMPLPGAYAMAGVMVMTLPMLWNYFSLGNADHHAPLAVLFIWAMGGVLCAHPSRSLMLASGVLLGLQLWVSVEALILIALIYGWYGLCWLRGDDSKMKSLAWMASTSALTTLLALMIERPIHQWAVPIYDSISIVHGWALTLAALLAWGLSMVAPRRVASRVMVALFGGIAMLALLAFTYPQFFMGPMVGVDPFILSDFLPRISEAKPFYKISPLTLLATLLVPLLALALCFAPWLSGARLFYSRETSRMLAWFLIGTLLLYLGQQRWSYYLLPLSVVAVAPLLAALFTPEHALVATRWPARALLALSPKAQATKRLPFTLAVLGLPLAFMLIEAAPELAANAAVDSASTHNTTQLLTKQRDDCYQAARSLIRSGELVRQLGNHSITLHAPTDLGMEILFFTPHRIIASNYHREGAGIQFVWEANKISDEKLLRSHLKKRNVEALLICPTVEPTKGSLLHAYAHGAPLPAWLRRIRYDLPARAGHKKNIAPFTFTPLLVRVTSP